MADYNHVYKDKCGAEFEALKACFLVCSLLMTILGSLSALLLSFLPSIRKPMRSGLMQIGKNADDRNSE